MPGRGQSKDVAQSGKRAYGLEASAESVASNLELELPAGRGVVVYLRTTPAVTSYCCAYEVVASCGKSSELRFGRAG